MSCKLETDKIGKKFKIKIDFGIEDLKNYSLSILN